MAAFVDRLFARAPWMPLLGYIALVLCLSFVTSATLDSLLARYAARDDAQALLDQIEGRARPGARIPVAQPGVPGSPFLEGQTVTVAGAALQQRMGNAVKTVGGNVLSSQVDLQGIDSKKGFVTLTTSCEVDQPALQQLLYDLEAGMPYLYIDQLTVQAPQQTGAENARMRVLIGVSGQWQGTR
ncbi:MAG: type II secretion system protein M [Methylobacteriaceae bacterium]|nr:type II secretion system protein M [Methylobacteriaceae bacterium]